MRCERQGVKGEEEVVCYFGHMNVNGLIVEFSVYLWVPVNHGGVQ